MSQAKVIQVIATTSTRGRGTPEDPVRVVEEYYTLDGELLWERDNWLGLCAKCGHACMLCAPGPAAGDLDR